MTSRISNRPGNDIVPASTSHRLKITQRTDNRSTRNVKTTETQERYRSAFKGEESRTQRWKLQAGDNSFTAANAGGNKKLPSGLASVLDRLPHKTFEGEKTGKVALTQKDGAFQSAHASGSGHVEVLSAHVKATGGIELSGARATAHGELAGGANLVQVNGQLKAGYGPLKAHVNGQAYVGVKGNLAGNLTLDPAQGVYAARVGGQAFLGAKAGVEGSVNLKQYAGVGGSAEAWAGLGVKGNAEAGFDKGVFKFKVEAGAALGIGCKFGVSGEVNFKAIGEAATRAVDKGIAWAKDHFVREPAKSFKKLLASLF